MVCDGKHLGLQTPPHDVVHARRWHVGPGAQPQCGSVEQLCEVQLVVLQFKAWGLCCTVIGGAAAGSSNSMLALLLICAAVYKAVACDVTWQVVVSGRCSNMQLRYIRD